MSMPTESDKTGHRAGGAQASQLPKKTYTSPRLTIYGDLRRLTQAKGRNQSDGAANTRFGG